jgi:hypothetical protein
LEPKSYLQNGKLSEPIITLLEAAFGFDRAQMQATRWVDAGSVRIGTILNIQAIVLADRVVYDSRKTDSYSDLKLEWFRLISHEMAHRQQVHQAGLIGFYSSYIAEHLRQGYYGNRYEQEAYRYGFGSADDLATRLYNFGQPTSVSTWLHCPPDPAQQLAALRYLGQSFRDSVS